MITGTRPDLIICDDPIRENIPARIKHNKKLEKRCIKCRKWQLIEGNFGKHGGSSDGYQSICRLCKNIMNAEKKSKDVVRRLRHTITTRCGHQLGEKLPKGFAKDVEMYLGYRIRSLVRHLREDLQLREPGKKLRDAMDEGYHVDHIKPLSLYPVIVDISSKSLREQEELFSLFISPLHAGRKAQLPIFVAQEDGKYIDWRVFQDCWRIENLSAISGAENLAKGAKYAGK